MQNKEDKNLSQKTACKFDDSLIAKALISNYNSVHVIDLENNTYQEITAPKILHDKIGSTGVASGTFASIMKILCNKDYLSQLLTFINLKTLSERLKDANTISFNFLGTTNGWCQARFMVLTRSEESTPTEVLFTTRIMDPYTQKILTYVASMPVAYAVFKAILDEGGDKVVDAKYLYVNVNYNLLSNAKRDKYTGHNYSKYFNIDDSLWFEHAQQVVFEKISIHHHKFSKELNSWLSINVFPLEEEGCFACTLLKTEENEFD